MKPPFPTDYSLPSTSTARLPGQPPETLRKSWTDHQAPKARREPPKGWRYCVASDEMPVENRESVEEFDNYGLDNEQYSAEEEEQPTTALFEFPPDSKLYRCTRTEGDKRDIYYIPVPSHATVNDVENLLPPDIRICSKLEIEVVENHNYQFIPKEFAPIPQIPSPAPPTVKPILVNPKQFDRIMKRRAARDRMEKLGILPFERQKYLYESRHAHAMKRKRMACGRFDTTESDPNDESIQIMETPTMVVEAPIRAYTTYAVIQPAPWNQVKEFSSENYVYEPMMYQNNHNDYEDYHEKL